MKAINQHKYCVNHQVMTYFYIPEKLDVHRFKILFLKKFLVWI